MAQDLKVIYEKLEELQKIAYCPYSKYPVSSFVEDESGNIYPGVNVENAVYPVGICAERSAVFNLRSSGGKKIAAVYLLAGHARKSFPTPCGACRQVVCEFAVDNDIPFYIFNHTGDYRVYTMGELLTHQWHLSYED